MRDPLHNRLKDLCILHPRPLHRLSTRSVSPVLPFPLFILLTRFSAKKKKFPDGYPGDVYSDDTSKPVKYACHKCSKVFPPLPHPDSEEGKSAAGAAPPECVRCKHPKCESCPRAAPATHPPQGRRCSRTGLCVSSLISFVVELDARINVTRRIPG